MMRWLGVVSCLLAVSCNDMFAKDDGHAFGDDLGRFTVGARLKSTTCGAQALDTPAEWNFDVVLSRDDDLLYWNTGKDAVEGALESDGRSFSFSSETVVDLDTTGNVRNCIMVRSDSMSGAFEDAKAMRTFEGSLTYRFQAKAGSDCTDLVAAGAFEELPCSLTYRMAAGWVSER